MHIRVGYYAVLRERRGLDEEFVEVTDSRLLALYQGLAAKHRFGLEAKHIRPAVNDALCDWEQPLGDGDFVVFVPPVAGG